MEGFKVFTRAYVRVKNAKVESSLKFSNSWLRNTRGTGVAISTNEFEFNNSRQLQLCKIYSQDDNDKTLSLWVLCKRVFVTDLNYWIKHPFEFSDPIVKPEYL